MTHTNCKPYKLFVIAGEKSGDAIAGEVLQPISHLIEIEGVVGPELKKIGAKELFSIESFQVMGLGSIIKNLPRLIALFLTIKKTLLKHNPQAVLLVDNAEFSLLIAKHLRKSGYSGKIIQLIPPSVWAWRKHRIRTLETYFDLVLSIFPFEKKFFSSSSLAVEYIGHPLIKSLHKIPPLAHPKKPLIALFPGSRKRETLLNLPLQLAAVQDLKTHEIAVSVASDRLLPLIEKIVKNSGVNARLVPADKRFSLMQEAEFALSKLGTINLELAFFEVPTITSFPLPFLERWVLQHLFKVFLPHYSIVNILAERRLFPEYIASFATVSNLKQEAQNFASSPELRALIQSGCRQVKNLLETEDFSLKGYSILSKVLLDI